MKQWVQCFSNGQQLLHDLQDSKTPPEIHYIIFLGGYNDFNFRAHILLYKYIKLH